MTSNTSLQHAQQHLTDVMHEVFAERPHIDRMLAIGAGHRALERGTPFFEAVEIAEGVLKVWEAVVDGTVNAIIERRNRERLTQFRIKRMGLKLVEQILTKRMTGEIA